MREANLEPSGHYKPTHRLYATTQGILYFIFKHINTNYNPEHEIIFE